MAGTKGNVDHSVWRSFAAIKYEAAGAAAVCEGLLREGEIDAVVAAEYKTLWALLDVIQSTTRVAFMAMRPKLVQHPVPPTEQDIQLVMLQTGADRDCVVRALGKHHGDLVNATMEAASTRKTTLE